MFSKAKRKVTFFVTFVIGLVETAGFFICFFIQMLLYVALVAVLFLSSHTQLCS